MQAMFALSLLPMMICQARPQPSPLPIFPPPQQAQVFAACWPLRLPITVEAPPALAGPAELLRRELKTLFGAQALSPAGKTIITLALAPSQLPRAEQYSLEATSPHLFLRAHDVQGAFWAVHSLLQVLSSDLLAPAPGAWRLPSFKVTDFPETSFRAFMLQAAWAQDLQLLRKALALLASCKVRYVAVEFGPQIVLDFDPSIARGARFSKQQAKSLIDYARSLGLEPIGYLNLLGHLDRAYQKSPYTGHGGLMIQEEAVYESFVFPILSEMLEVYGPIKWFHCGMDEAEEVFAWLAQQGYDCAALLARHISKINTFLKQRGVRMVIWHDMLLTPQLGQQLGAPVGPAHGGPPHNTAAALNLLPKDVILDYWFYGPLAAYPALDWLKAKGFEVWASPWQTPFSLVRYASRCGSATLGTIWADPPYCFTAPSLAPVFALYSWATWNPRSAPEAKVPETQVGPTALDFTLGELWGRKRQSLVPSKALLVRPADGQIAELAWPQPLIPPREQHAGLPFDFSAPAVLEPLAGKKAQNLERAAFALLPDGTLLRLDGINKGRGEDELILYTGPLQSTGTNIYGVEVAVAPTGEVLETAGYGAGNMPIPAGGFVLSAHLGPQGQKANALRRLAKYADRVAILDEQGHLLAGFPGGYTVVPLKVRLPDGTELGLDGVNRERGENELILYLPGYGEGSTGTNEWGVEVVVEQGRVAEVRSGVGNAPLPAHGYVLSAHSGRSPAKAKALASLKIGDEVKLLAFSVDSQLLGDEALAGKAWEAKIQRKCQALFFALATHFSTLPGNPLGQFEVRFADGTQALVPIQYGLDALPLTPTVLPLPRAGQTWLVLRPTEPQRVLVREWANPKPQVAVERLRFAPSPYGLASGIHILAITALLPP
jgi:hypothetical protein